MQSRNQVISSLQIKFEAKQVQHRQSAGATGYVEKPFCGETKAITVIPWYRWFFGPQIILLVLKSYLPPQDQLLPPK